MIVFTASIAAADEGARFADVLAERITSDQAALDLPNAPDIYHLRAHVMQLDQVDVHASFGSLVEANHDPFNLLAVELRLGAPAYDNTGFGGWQDGFVRSALPQRLTDRAVEIELWRATDAAYKQAVEQFGRKSSQFAAPADHPGDYTLTGAVVADRGAAPVDPATDSLPELAIALSAAIAGPDPSKLLRAEVYVGREAGSLLTVDTEGTQVRTPVSEATLRAVASTRAGDGMLLTDHRVWTVRRAADLPDREAMLAEASKLREDLLSAAAAPPLEDEYVGPVVFEDQAALDVLRYVLVRQLEGTPPEVPFDSVFGELGGDSDPTRLGRRVLPPGWRAVDDPLARPEHPGAYEFDNEGTRAVPVTLVDDGIVKTVAMSRVPRKGVDGTNGHARGVVGERAAGRVTMLEVEPDRHRSRAALYRQGLKLAKAYGRDWIIVVRRLQEPCVLSLDTHLPFDDGPALPPPIIAVKRYRDGREEPIRGGSFAGIERFVVRDIVAAGPEREGDYFAPFTPGGSYAALAPTEGMASHLRGPDLLVGELEIVPSRPEPREVPVIPPPPGR